MKVIFLCVALVACVYASDFSSDCEGHFEIFKNKFFKSYTATEFDNRKSVFCENMARVDAKNAKNGKDVFGITKFSDWTKEEFKVLLGRKDQGHIPSSEQQLKVRSSTGTVHTALASTDTSNTVDWVDAGYVTPVKNQGQCGSCWAHSAVEQIESEFMLLGYSMWEFSVAQVNSCVKNCLGCGGGDTTSAYEYLEGEIGLGSSAWAPYIQSMTKTCLGRYCTEKCDDIDVEELSTQYSYTGYYAQVNSYEYATTPCYDNCDHQNMTALANNIKTYGPASICLNAGEWSDYTGGILTVDGCGGYSYDDLDHCVQLTGYGVDEDGNKYWNVRNSWSTDWGINGYIRLEMSDTANTCGLANEATQVNIELPSPESRRVKKQ